MAENSSGRDGARKPSDTPLAEGKALLAGPKRPPPVGSAELGLLVVVAAWAMNFSLVKYAVGIWDAYAFNLLRLAAGVAVLLAAWALSRRRTKFEWSDAPKLLGLAFVGHVVFQLGFIHGTDASSAGSAALILALIPLMIAVMAWTSRAEPFCRHTAAGLVVSGAGVALVSGAEPTTAALLGDLWLFFAAVGWAVYTVWSAPLVRKYGPVRLCAWTVTLGALILTLPAPFFLDSADFTAAPSAGLWAAVVSGVAAISLAHIFWGHASARVGPTLTGVYSQVVPLPALVISWLWLGETLPAAKLIGGFLVLAGISLARMHWLWSGDRVHGRAAA